MPPKNNITEYIKKKKGKKKPHKIKKTPAKSKKKDESSLLKPVIRDAWKDKNPQVEETAIRGFFENMLDVSVEPVFLNQIIPVIREKGKGSKTYENEWSKAIDKFAYNKGNPSSRSFYFEDFTRILPLGMYNDFAEQYISQDKMGYHKFLKWYIQQPEIETELLSMMEGNTNVKEPSVEGTRLPLTEKEKAKVKEEEEKLKKLEAELRELQESREKRKKELDSWYLKKSIEEEYRKIVLDQKNIEELKNITKIYDPRLTDDVLSTKSKEDIITTILASNLDRKLMTKRILDTEYYDDINALGSNINNLRIEINNLKLGKYVPIKNPTQIIKEKRAARKLIGILDTSKKKPVTPLKAKILDESGNIIEKPQPLVKPTPEIDTDRPVFVSPKCMQDYRRMPWLDAKVESIWITPAPGEDIPDKYIIQGRTMEWPADTWYMASSLFSYLRCSGFSTNKLSIPSQDKNILTLYTHDEDTPIRVKVGYRTNKGFIIQDEEIFKKEKEWFNESRKTRAQKVKDYLSAPLNQRNQKYLLDILSKSLLISDPNNYDYGATDKNTTFLKTTLDLIIGKSNNVGQVIDKIADIYIYITGNDGDEIFKKRLALEYYTPEVLVELTKKDKLPSIYDNVSVTPEQRKEVDSILDRRRKKFRNNTLEWFYLMYHPTERVPTRVYELEHNIIPPKNWRQDCDNLDDIKKQEKEFGESLDIPDYKFPDTQFVYYVDNDEKKNYCFIIDILKDQFEKKDYTNPYTKKQFEKKFINRVINVFSKDIIDPLNLETEVVEEEKVKKLDESEVEKVPPVAPNLLKLMLKIIVECEQEYNREHEDDDNAELIPKYYEDEDEDDEDEDDDEDDEDEEDEEDDEDDEDDEDEDDKDEEKGEDDKGGDKDEEKGEDDKGGDNESPNPDSTPITVEKSVKSKFVDKPAPGTEIIENITKDACVKCNKSINTKTALKTKNMVSKDI